MHFIVIQADLNRTLKSILNGLLDDVSQNRVQQLVIALKHSRLGMRFGISYEYFYRQLFALLLILTCQTFYLFFQSFHMFENR